MFYVSAHLIDLLLHHLRAEADVIWRFRSAQLRRKPWLDYALAWATDKCARAGSDESSLDESARLADMREAARDMDMYEHTMNEIDREVAEINATIDHLNAIKTSAR